MNPRDIAPTPRPLPPRRGARRVAGALVALLMASAIPAGAQTVRQDLWITNGTVNATAIAGDTLYVGGAFTAIAPATGCGVPLDANTGRALDGLPEVSGSVSTVVPDGSGGWYIGGLFTTVGGQPRTNLAHVLADLSVDPWAPVVNNTVRALLVTGGTIHIGGDFTSAGGQSRSQIAELDLGTGLATGWNPGANGLVWALATDGSVIYVGGDFTTIGGQNRSRIAALDPATNSATGWNPGATGSVRTLTTHGAWLYAGGLFSTIGGQSRNRLAALSTTTGTPGVWNPNANNQVSALVLSDGTVYVGGSFTSVGGQIRGRIAALDTLNGAATAWNPGANSQVLAIAVDGAVYIGGDFTTAGGQTRSRLAAIDAALGVATSWDPNTFSTVNALSAGGGVVYAGGSFNATGGVSRNNIAALSTTTGEPFAWNPNCNNMVLALALGDGNVYVGGGYTSIGGASRNNLAAISTATGLATGWNPNLDGSVSALATRGGTVWAGGTFTNVGGTGRNNLAAIDANGVATGWNPNVDGTVFALALEYSTIHVGGSFTNAGGAARNNLAEISLSTGLAGPWNPNANGTVRALSISCGTVYVGGFFTTIGGQSRNRIAEVDPNTGAVMSWNPNANGPVFMLARGNGQLYVGGVLNVIGGQTRNRIASIDLISGNATAWDPNANNVVRAISTWGGQVYAGGSFTQIGGLSQANLAGISADGSVSCAPVTVTPSTLPTGRAGTAYSVPFGASGGPAPFCYSVTSGALPPGLTLAGDTGLLSGTPGALGTYVFTVTATNSIGCTGAVTVTLIVFPACQTLAFSPDTLVRGRLGVPYSRTLTVSGGTAPYAFALTVGTPPAGLSLSGTGLLSGTPGSAGTSSFTVGVTDSTGCTGSRVYSIVIDPPCPVFAPNPPVLVDAVLGAPYHATLTAGAGTAPFTWTVSSGTLPAGLGLGAATGAIDGTPTSAGTVSFEITATDATGCTGVRGYTMTVFPTAPLTSVAALSTGSCITTAHPCVAIPMMLTRGESAPARAVSVTFHLDTSRITLCAPATPTTSIHPGGWLAAFDPIAFEVVDNGGGSYTVDQSVLGVPCGATVGGTLFTMDLKSAIPGDGTGTITVDAVQLRDCDGAAIPATAGAPAALTIDHSGPAAIADLVSTQVLSGNGPGSTTGIRLTWSAPVTADLYRAPYGSYPLYDHAGPVTPPDPTLAPGGPWTLAASAAASGLVDHPGTRGFWMYVAITTDACGFVARSNRSAGALDYHLGDVSDGLTVGQGDDQVTPVDLSLLGAHYGIADPVLAARDVQYLDVGPTTDSAPTSRPVPDGVLDFEDLMIFSTNVGMVSAPPSRSVPAHLVPAPTGVAASPERFSLDAPSLVTPGVEVEALLRLAAAGAMQGFSARLAWDAAVVEPAGWSGGGLVEGQGGVVLSSRPGVIDAARLGTAGGGISGEGVVATVRFRVLHAGDPGFRLVSVDARDGVNHKLAPTAVTLAERVAPPTETVLLAPQPNPARGEASLAFTLASPGSVDLSVYSVDGRRVRSLATGARAAGVYHLVWDGRDEGRNAVASGVYYLHLEAGGRRFTRTLVMIR
ncbi:MAG: putative Ig domain-containing protein [Candidatus Eisenbacteria bacterium]